MLDQGLELPIFDELISQPLGSVHGFDADDVELVVELVVRVVFTQPLRFVHGFDVVEGMVEVVCAHTSLLQF